MCFQESFTGLVQGVRCVRCVCDPYGRQEGCEAVTAAGGDEVEVVAPGAGGEFDGQSGTHLADVFGRAVEEQGAQRGEVKEQQFAVIGGAEGDQRGVGGGYLGGGFGVQEVGAFRQFPVAVVAGRERRGRLGVEVLWQELHGGGGGDDGAA